jgi:hypothetical protein
MEYEGVIVPILLLIQIYVPKGMVGCGVELNNSRLLKCFLSCSSYLMENTETYKYSLWANYNFF